MVSLSELDKPVFEDMLPKEWSAFKTLCSAPSKLFWVTSGRLHEKPFSNMTVGFARTAVFETPTLQFQNVDIPDLQSLKPQSLVEKILRFHASATASPVVSERSRLPWPLEPEIVVNAEGQEFVPRLRHIAARNDRYNSARRPITNMAVIAKSPAALHKDADGWKLKELSRWAISADSESRMKLEVSHAVLSALRTSRGHQFLVLGTKSKSPGTILGPGTLPSVCRSCIHGVGTPFAHFDIGRGRSPDNSGCLSRLHGCSRSSC